MATTNLKPHHIIKGKTIEQTVKDSFDYGQNPIKTQGGELVVSYMCDPETAYHEFLLSKAKYRSITGREQKIDDDVLFYQIRQSFLTGEIDPDGALKIGYDLAMRWTKGKHAFFVTSHVDRPHPHIHIYYNSTTLDCSHKFRNFFGSTWAVRRLSDRICFENNLSVITNPKLHSKSKYKHYGEWLGDNKTPNFQERLKMQIDICLTRKPKSFDDFLREMTLSGYEIKHKRGGGISFRTQGQERFTQLRASTLGEGYGQEDIQAIIDSYGVSSGNQIGKKQVSDYSHKVNLIIDIQARMKTGKGPAYEKWAKVHNLKQMAAALQYLQENGITNYEQLDNMSAKTSSRFHSLSAEIKSLEESIKINSKLRTSIIDYAKTRPVFEEYKAKKYSNKYLNEHKADIEKYRAAQATFKHILNGSKLPKMDSLTSENRELVAKKKTAYKEYRTVKKDMQELVVAKSNIDYLLGITDGRNKEQER